MCSSIASSPSLNLRCETSSTGHIDLLPFLFPLTHIIYRSTFGKLESLFDVDKEILWVVPRIYYSQCFGYFTIFWCPVHIYFHLVPYKFTSKKVINSLKRQTFKFSLKTSLDFTEGKVINTTEPYTASPLSLSVTPPLAAPSPRCSIKY